ncbi:MAG TPA: helix-turn-helix domain-containing protein, partial [Bryobacteraceae bacterium]|nr:helix-turn-helix domain-containing protein [Bryobacteraceae bacterium]
MTLLEQLGRRIGELRREQKFSREQLAQKAGLSTRFLADVEAGRGNIAISRLHDLCTALDHPLAKLMASLPEALHSGNG